MRVATALASGNQPEEALASEAVSAAMHEADITLASSVLLFLTADFAHDPLPALRAAARAANCTQIMGCSAPGIFTEREWVIDAPAAAAMVFPAGVSLQPPLPDDDEQLLLAMTAPNAININWMNNAGRRFGGVSGDATGRGPFSVWQYGQGSATGYCQARVQGARGEVAVAHGLRMLGVPQQITTTQGHDVKSIAGQPALAHLQQALAGQRMALHRMMLVVADSRQQLQQNDYRLASLVSGNENDSSVTVAKPVAAGQWMSWAVREPAAAVQDFQQTAAALAAKLQHRPDFALLFSCLGRGPYFYGNVDLDLATLKTQFPGMPLIGFYGNGEIAPCDGGSELLQYSAVLGLFSTAPV